MPTDLNPLQSNIDNSQSAYDEALANRRNPIDLYNEAVSSLGGNEIRQNVGNLRKQILDTENLLNGVEGSVQGRTSGSLVTEAQRQRLTNLERAPIAGQYNKFASNLSSEQSALNEVLGLASNQTNLTMAGEDRAIEALLSTLNANKEKYNTAKEQNQWEDENKKWWEQFNANKAAADRQFAESQRQFNINQGNIQTQINSNNRALKAQDIISSIPNLGTSGNGDYNAWGNAVEKLRAAGYSEGEITSMNNYLASRFGSNQDKAYFGV